MLLLVLILVLIAFGLLVVALLSGSVLWAWVSVGVSVAAAAVLLVDWLQRRSAVRAGAEAGDAAPIGRLRRTCRTGIRSSSRPRRSSPRSAPDGSAPRESARARSSRRTVATNGGRGRRPSFCRAVAPPGSAGGPSGARGGIGPSEPNWSQNVTNSEATGKPVAVPATAVRPGPTRADPDAEDTVKVAGAPGPADAAPHRDGPVGGPARAVPPRRAAAQARPWAARPAAARPGRRPAGGAARRRRGRPRGRASTTRSSSSTSCRATTWPGVARSSGSR